MVSNEIREHANLRNPVGTQQQENMLQVTSLILTTLGSRSKSTDTYNIGACLRENKQTNKQKQKTNKKKAHTNEMSRQ